MFIFPFFMCHTNVCSLCNEFENGGPVLEWLYTAYV